MNASDTAIARTRGEVDERTPWADAREAARNAAEPTRAVDLPLDAALGTVLATPLPALVAAPPFDNSAMDGYAVAGTGPWTVVGCVRAGGAPHPGRLEPGQAIEIATGAPVPAGTDAVLPIEDSLRAGDSVSGEVRHAGHVRRKGESCQEGQLLLTSGTTVTPAVLGLAAAAGHDELRVHRRPRVAVLVTGDEVVASGRPGHGQVRDAISPMLTGLLHLAGAEQTCVRRLADRADVLAEALSDTGVDVLVVCGATSAGPADHLRPVLRRLGADLRVAGVACRPGHPQVLAVLPDGRTVVGLPGNPHAALGAAMTLLQPLLQVLSGRRAAPLESAWLAEPVDPHPRDTRLVAVTRLNGSASPVGHDRPGTLWGAALADALAVIPPGWAGEDVELLALPGLDR
ncbi:MAG: molybdopterin molybdenumtransferase MoeA [Amycolatopsis sp.]|uniref:molybdopterin molybdotransferase MoeA n=1 Tax=Amycolatopsis sp. TaxID=37632 RepID=UPI00261DB677|nr:molybdopterin molybdotransferase MoeA [Amycolatopsis sp.]MCU1682388.1 molybdopterin molybdenumtransferase MoeA [Amycolatopsis sp.]